MKVKAIHDFVSHDGLVPTLLVFKALLDTEFLLTVSHHPPLEERRNLDGHNRNIKIVCTKTGSSSIEYQKWPGCV